MPYYSLDLLEDPRLQWFSGDLPWIPGLARGKNLWIKKNRKWSIKRKLAPVNVRCSPPKCMIRSQITTWRSLCLLFYMPWASVVTHMYTCARVATLTAGWHLCMGKLNFSFLIVTLTLNSLSNLFIYCQHCSLLHLHIAPLTGQHCRAGDLRSAVFLAWFTAVKDHALC